MTWAGGKRSFLEAIPLSLGLIALLIIYKVFYVLLFNSTGTVFSFQYTDTRMNDILYACLFYAIFCFPQELIARGMLQGSFQELQTNMKKNNIWLPIFASNIIYGSFHAITLTLDTAILVTLTGIAWGWLYSRHKTLVGPIFSHVVVGLFAFYVLGTTH